MKLKSKTIAKMKRLIETEKLNNENLDNAVVLINQIISNFKKDKAVKNYITTKDIRFTDNFLSEQNILNSEGQVRKLQKLSKIIFNLYYPKPKEKLFYHYTKLSSLDGILNHGFKLSQLSKNINFHEFKTFYKDHNLKGYNKLDSNGIEYNTKIMNESYALSLASSKKLSIKSNNKLWRIFGDQGRGLKLEVSISSKHPDFREIYYRDCNKKNKLLLNILNEKIKNEYDRLLFVAGISKIGSFYLPGELEIENEVRFLIKKNTDQYKFSLKDTPKKKFVYLPFKSKYAKIKLTKIFIRDKNLKSDIRNVLKKYNKSNIKVEAEKKILDGTVD